MEFKQLEGVQDLTLEEAIEALHDIRENLKRMKEAEYLLYRVVVEGMEERKATLTRTDDHVARLTTSITYDYGKLAALREITAPEDLDRVYYPAHEETKTVPEKWNMAVGRRLIQLGAEHQAIIDAARIPGRAKVDIYEKGAESTR